MSKPSRRPTREERKIGWKELKKARRELNRREVEEGLERQAKPTRARWR